MITQINHTEKATDLMLRQFKDANDLLNLLRSWMYPVDEIEQALIDFINANGVTSAQGAMLDIIGSWVGVDRNSRIDIEYRQSILGKVLLETMDGSCQKFYKGMETLCNSSEVTFHEGYPTTVYAQLGEGWTNASFDQVKAIKMAGVGFVLLVDYHLDSLIMSELVSIDNTLVTHTGETYELVVDGVATEWLVSVSNNSVYDTSGDYLAEILDTDFTPMAEVVTKTYTVKLGFITDESGNYITDSDGNRFTYREF